MIDRIHGGNIWPYPEKVIDFSANINPLGLPLKAKGILIKNISALRHYPEPESKSLKKALSSFHKVSPGNILVGNGSMELIYLIPNALKAKRALIVGPTFSEYEFALKSNGAKPFFLMAREGDDFRIDIAKIKNFIPKVDLVFLCNPNNPTGSLIPKEEILNWLALCRKYNTILVIDEVFMDFVKAPQEFTLVSEAVKNKRFLVLRSLTKFFALAGLRIGYLVAHQSIIKQLSLFQYPWNINSLAQRIGKEVLKDKEYIRRSGELILKERIYLFENLKKIKGLKAYYPGANFIFLKLEGSRMQSSLKLRQRLLENGILIRSCHNFRGLNSRFFRVAVRTRKENARLAACLRKILG